MKVFILSTILISSIVFGQKSSTSIPFVGVREFNFSSDGFGTCCNVSIKIDKKGNCKIYAGFEETLMYSGKFKTIMNGYKVYRQNGKLYAAMVNSKGKVESCIDNEDNNIPCIFELY